MRRLGLFSAAVVGLLLSSLANIQTSASEAQSVWNDTLKLELAEFVADPSTIPNPLLSCSEYTVTTRPFAALPSPPFIQTEKTHTGCFTNTSNGLIDGTYFLAKNTTIAGKITSDQSPTLLGVPNSKVLFYGKSLPYPAYYFGAYRDPISRLSAARNSSYEVSYKLIGPADVWIADADGNKLPIIPSSISYAKNGQWMAADVPGVGTIRVNLDTFEVLPFGYKSMYFEGRDPAIRTTVTSDGRFAAAYSTSRSDYFSVFDLSSCDPVPSRIVKPVACRETNLIEFLRSQAPPNSTFMNVRAVSFINNHTMQLFVGYRPNGATTTKVGKYLLKAGDGQTFNLSYLAMGDSFTSGEGTHDYEHYTDIPENRCHLSKQSYPYVIGRQRQMNSFRSVACSGAKTIDIVENTSEYNRDGAQAKKKIEPLFNDEIFSNFLPGYRAQRFFLDYSSPAASLPKLRPEIITLGIGGNDVGFGDIIKLCVQPDTCFAAKESRLEKVQEISRQFDTWAQTLQSIKESSPGSRIYALGYPKITSLNEKCGINVRLDSEELKFADGLVVYLNSVIRQAAKRAGVIYTDIEESLASTALCSGASDSEISVNGLTAGDDKLPGIGPLGNESYHPNQRGHALMAEAVLSSTSNLSEPMPAKDPAAKPPDTAGLVFVDSAPATDRPPRYLINDPDITLLEQIRRGEDLSFDLRNKKYLLQPHSNADALIYSEPTLLGTLTVDSNGKATGTFTVPETIQPGFHTLHVMATNIAGEPISIYKVIFITASDTDFDGDGTPNHLDDCWLVPDSDIDSDQDGIDDACDPEITDPPSDDPSPISIPGSVTEDEPEDPKSWPPTYSNPHGSEVPPLQEESLTVTNPASPNIVRIAANTVPAGTVPNTSTPVTDINNVAQQVLSANNLAQLPSPQPNTTPDVKQPQHRESIGSYLWLTVPLVLFIWIVLALVNKLRRA